MQATQRFLAESKLSTENPRQIKKGPSTTEREQWSNSALEEKLVSRPGKATADTNSELIHVRDMRSNSSRNQQY